MSTIEAGPGTEFLTLPRRPPKPRQVGITHVLDKGLTLQQVEGLFDACGEYIDIVKLGWGTSYVTRNLREKLALYEDLGVPVVLGGTLWEVCLAQQKLDEWRRWVGDLGLRHVEISDGTVSIPHEAKLGYISRLSQDFIVLSEVGSKDIQTVIAPYRWVELIEAELRAGAWKVITEARESGTAGIYRADGEVRMGLIDEIIHAVDPNRLLFEAPQKAQQVWFIKKFGPNVNLGNIPPDEVIALETLRLGLRADTLRTVMPIDNVDGAGISTALATAPGPIAPHGGVLVDRLEPGLEAVDRPTVRLSARQQADLDLIAVGALSPMAGFMGREVYESVLEAMRLPNGLAWSVPITLAPDAGDLAGIGDADEVALLDDAGRFIGVMTLEERFDVDPRKEARLVYGTEEEAHPGVAALYQHGSTCLSGPVRVAARMPIDPSAEPYRLDPRDARERFDTLGWGTVVGFQTRNPIHRAHEYLTKVALEIVDGLLLHPLVGETKSDDIPAGVRIHCYTALIERYYPVDRVVLGVLPAAMRYAGPREAILHAVMRQNYGCTHFIVGRDHAGVGSYYGTYDAHRIFDDIGRDELGIQPLFFEHAFWCKITGGMATTKTSPAGPDDRVFLSGTAVRQMLDRGEEPPVEFTRPEVARILIDAYASGAAGG